jgi:hypothetical protein
MSAMADKPTQAPPPQPQPIRPSPMITETREGGGPRETK